MTPTRPRRKDFTMFRYFFLRRPDADAGIDGGMAANADAGNVAAPEGVADPKEGGEGAAALAAETAPAENRAKSPADTGVTETQAFSRRLNEKLSEAEKAMWDKVNPVIAKLGGTRPDGQPIQTFEDLQAAMDYQAMQEEAQKQNVPVELYSRLTQAEKDALEAKNMLSQYQRKEAMTKEAETLSADPKWGEFYKANEARIREVAEKTNCDLGTAKLIVYDEVGPTKVDEEFIANKAIQEFLDKKRTYNKPTEGSGAAPVTVAHTPTTYKEARDGALAYLRSLKE